MNYVNVIELHYLATYSLHTSKNIKKHSLLGVYALCALNIVPTCFNVTKSITCISISCAIGGGCKGLVIT